MADIGLLVAAFLFAILIATSFPTVNSSKILFFNGRGEGSHYTSAAHLAQELVFRGHEVTFLLDHNYKYRATDPVYSKLFHFKMVETNSSEDVELKEEHFKRTYNEENVVFSIQFMSRLTEVDFRYCRLIFEGKLLEELRSEDYDMMIFEPFWQCSIALSEALNVKRVAFIQASMCTNCLRVIGHPINAATTPEFGLGFPTGMSFVQRVLNFVVAVFFQHILKYCVPAHGLIFQLEGVSSLADSARKIDFVITSSDPLIDKVVPMYPGHITAAGMTTKPAEQLSKNFEEFMKSSGEHGVIIFTIGTYATPLPGKIAIPFRDAFAQLPQKIIWQWKGETPLDDVPGNVWMTHRFPQNDLLGHNKTRLFIYHAGNTGLYEAIYHGVPIIAMPLLPDHHDTAQSIVEKEIGLKIRLSDLTGDLIVQQINEVLTNEKYRNNAERMSIMFRDRPQNPREKAAYWIEHVLKYGSDHLQIPGSDMSFIQYYLIDVIAFLTICVALTIFLVYLVLMYTLRAIGSMCISSKAKVE